MLLMKNINICSTDSATKSTTSSRLRICSKKCIRIESCEIGDTVLIVWNDTLHRYTIAQVRKRHLTNTV